jgi:phage FluMu protein Com
MNNIMEQAMKKFTEHRILCPYCQRNNNFEYVVKHSDSQYYLGEKCPKCEHYDDFRSVSYRVASDYMVVKQKNG